MVLQLVKRVLAIRAARSVALIYNWWSLFVRLADPDQHREVITSRPPLQAIARKTQQARPHHAVGEQHPWPAANSTAGLSAHRAEQLDAVQRWYHILSEALRKYPHGRQPISPARRQPG